MQSKPNSSLGRARAAFALACQRWDFATGEAMTRSLDEEMFRYAALSEVLFWATALDDALPGHKGNDLCLGLRFARNRVVHDLLFVTDTRPGAWLPATLPARLQHYVWRSASELPLPETGLGSGSGGKLQRDAYLRAWEGIPVDCTFHELSEHLG